MGTLLLKFRSNDIKIKYNLIFLCSIICIFSFSNAIAITKISTGTGNFSNPGSWMPAGLPATGDVITIQNNHIITVDNNVSINSITINTGGKLIWSPGKKLTIANGITINGTVELNDGDIELTQSGKPFKIGSAGSFTWQPSNNSIAGATLFTNGIEDFHPTSTLIINKWYNYTSVPLGSVVTGNFGNLAVTTLSNGLLFEWNQNNQFEIHKILGKFTIDQGWIVLDKSGTISNTTIGELFLKNVNSYIDFHSGDHPGSLTVKTNNITNIGGTLNGIYNGNGNIYVEVTGDILNLGNIELIYNSGVQNTSNGNASIKVTGLYKQTTGDFRGIFNISSTSSGTANLEFGSMELSGGIFMAQYACHSGNQFSTLIIHNNLTLDYINANSKFRGNGLNSLSGIQSNLKLNFIVHGDLMIKGNPLAEFTSSASTGIENVTINGSASFEGCNSNFNYGTHATTINFKENVFVKGGVTNLSKTNGSLNVTLHKNLNIQSGQLNFTSDNGNATLIISGDYNQTGGTVYFHCNDALATSNPSYLTVNGNFTNNSGTITFDNNASSTASHVLSLTGNNYILNGQSVITSSLSPINPVFSTIYFDNEGITEYNELSNSSKIQNIKQVISSGCTLKITNGNMQAASLNFIVKDMIRIAPGGSIDAGAKQIYSNTSGLYSGIKVDEDGILKTSNPEGLYNGAANATIKANGNFTYTLHPSSTIEYYGSAAQIITGTGVGTAQSADQHYGVLKVNKQDASAKINSNVFVRKTLELDKGELNLNGHNLTIVSGSASSIVKEDGYIKSESLSSGHNGMVTWENIESGEHTIPFGIASYKLIPFKFSPLTGLGGSLAISTRTSSKNNRPLSPGVSHINLNNSDISNDRVIDRWYHVSATGINANVTFSYLPGENSTISSVANKNFSAMFWKNSKWNIIGGTGDGKTTETGTVTIENCSSWGPILLVANDKLEQADLLNFNATLKGTQVELHWVSKPNITVQNYTVEKSKDSFLFEEISEITALPANTVAHSYYDKDAFPAKGISFYRLRQNSADGILKYSNMVQIEYMVTNVNNLQLNSVSPNPFSSTLNINCDSPVNGILRLSLVSLNGQLAVEKSIQVIAGKNNIIVNELDHLVTGIYLLSVTDGKTIKSFKLFKN